jgi:hypothetical protein
VTTFGKDFDHNRGVYRMSDEFRKQLIHARYSDRYMDDLKQQTVKSGQRLKVIVSGGVIEKYQYEIPVRIGKRQRVIDPETGEVLNGGRVKDDPNNPRKIEPKRTNGRRSKMQLRRLVLANFVNMDKFITLTIRDGAVSDVTDIKECNKEFDKFIKRMRRAFGDFRYCRVIEFQDKNDRGAVHYHCIMSLPFVPWETIRGTWGNGNIDIQAIDHVDNVGAYVTKYMSKDLADNRLAGVKAFATSQNLTRPVVTYGEEAQEIINSFVGQKKEVFAREYPSEYQGNIRYTEYNMNRE